MNEVEAAIIRARSLAAFERRLVREKGGTEVWRLPDAKKLEKIADTLTHLLQSSAK